MSPNLASRVGMNLKVEDHVLLEAVRRSHTLHLGQASTGLFSDVSYELRYQMNVKISNSTLRRRLNELVDRGELVRTRWGTHLWRYELPEAV